MFHHKQFNRRLAKMYIPFCRILDLNSGMYQTIRHIGGREFDGALVAASKVTGKVTAVGASSRASNATGRTMSSRRRGLPRK